MDLQSIEQRINAEYIKHKDSGLDWVKIEISKFVGVKHKSIVRFRTAYTLETTSFIYWN